VPSDPVVDARIRAIRDDGAIPFTTTSSRKAAIALKQGFGRLIRSRTDRGVLVLLDNRITKQRYGQIFFDSLPDYRFTTDRPKWRSFSMFEVTVEETFAAGHALRNYHGKCEHVHGTITNPRHAGRRTTGCGGLLVDFHEVKRVLNGIIERVDHKFLNDIAPSTR
jgi:hypothetical protein